MIFRTKNLDQFEMDTDNKRIRHLPANAMDWSPWKNYFSTEPQMPEVGSGMIVVWDPADGTTTIDPVVGYVDDGF
jgi:hypothetical protein